MGEQSFEKTSQYFLELASEQRLQILDSLVNHPYRVSHLAKKLGVTAQEIHRNFDRLSHAGFIRKGINDNYHITSTGKMMHAQLSLIHFISKNQKFFETHSTDDFHQKFIKRLGVLEECQQIKSVTSVLDKWKKIYQNASESIYDIISEFPHGLDGILMKKIKQGASYRHIMKNDLIEPENRDDYLQNEGYYDNVEDGKVQRRISKSVNIILVANEKEGALIFPSTNHEPDLRFMFYGNGQLFHEFCMDYFEYMWKRSSALSRTKPKGRKKA